jgi:hypothetical protein
MTDTHFTHDHFAHCESGVMSLMLRHNGLQLSEAMVFGLAGSLMFAYIPFVKLGGMPLIAYRSMPRSIIKGLQKNIGLKMKMQTFSKAETGTEALNKLLDDGKIVGAQSSVFWLPYFPPEMQFHFNGHNLIIYGKEQGEYLISDPVFEKPVRCEIKALQKARFVKGVMAPKGLLYYPEFVPDDIDFTHVLPKVIRKNAKVMLKTPLPIAGVRGIQALARKIVKLEKKDPRYARLFLGHIVRMQEEIGTGGAGFRFIYASFLQESGKLLDSPLLFECSYMMTAVGDQWREFAMLIAKSIRGKQKTGLNVKVISDKLLCVADAEKEVYKRLVRI